MVKVSEFYGIKIHFHWKDHNPPHFHADYAGKPIKVQIDPVQVLEGMMPPRMISFVLEWAALHQVELMQCWERTQSHVQPNLIEPLE